MKTEFKVNDTVRITGKQGNHNFKTGETGVIIEKNTDGGYKVKNEENWWWVFDYDIELVESTSTLIPNDLIISAHKEACVKWKRIIENACPELFKPKFEYDKWVKIENAEGGCYCANGVVGITRSNIPAGVSHSGMMEQDNGVFIQSDGYWYRIGVKTKIKYLTPSEVESHLIKVAEEKGYLKGVKIKSDYSNKEGVITGAFFMNDGDLCVNVEGNKSILVFDNETGKWATIIPSELTLEERVAKLEKMIK